MRTDIIISRTEGDITIRTATLADKQRYVELELQTGAIGSLAQTECDKGRLEEIIWNIQCNTECLMFAIIENTSGKTVGFCVIKHIDTEEPELGIVLDEAYRKKGYGYSAAKAMIGECFKRFDHSYFVWELEKDNIASKRLVLKLGGQLTDSKNTLPENIRKMMRDSGIEPHSEHYVSTVERYKIGRPE